MANILIVYSTIDGHTLKICKRIKQVLEEDSHNVSLISVDDESAADPASYDKIVVGASIRYGKHHPGVYDFIKKNEAILKSRPNAFFSVNAVARKEAKSEPHTNPYIKKFLKKSSWKPMEIAVFAGKIDYQKYSFRDRLIIRLIMWLTKGPTDPTSAVEFTHWEKVEAFGRRISTM